VTVFRRRLVVGIVAAKVVPQQRLDEPRAAFVNEQARARSSSIELVRTISPHTRRAANVRGLSAVNAG
jgi:hypothetical protein